MKQTEKEAKRLIFITGLPRTGKSTVLLRVAEMLRARGYKLGGMTSQEIREEGIRVGFEVCDYASGRKGWLAHVRQPEGPRVGKYRVNLHDLDSVGVAAIMNALRDADIVLIDEIGPMELFSEGFKESVQKAFDGCQTVLGTIHYRTQHSLVNQVKSRKDSAVIEVTLENRAHLPVKVVNKIIKLRQAKTV